MYSVLYILEAVEGGLYLLEVLDALEVSKVCDVCYSICWR